MFLEFRELLEFLCLRWSLC